MASTPRPVDWQSPRSVGAGLHNVGNTCFMNAVLQALAHTPAFAELLLAEEPVSPHDCPVHRELQAHVQRAFLCETDGVGKPMARSPEPFAPTAMAQTLRDLNSSFKLGQQEDAHEYFLSLLDNLEEAESKEAASDAPKPMREAIQAIFRGGIRSSVSCTNVAYTSSRDESFLDVSLEVQRARSLQQALKNYFSTDVLDGENRFQCPTSGTLERAVKTFRLADPPNVLVLHLKRFETFVGLGVADCKKITRHIKFQALLNMAPYLHDEVASKRCMYSLNAVIVHHGSCMDSGHYVAFVKAATGAWHLCDDSNVATVSLSTVLKQQAYMLVYTRNSRAAAALPTPVATARAVVANLAGVARRACSPTQKASSPSAVWGCGATGAWAFAGRGRARSESPRAGDGAVAPGELGAAASRESELTDEASADAEVSSEPGPERQCAASTARAASAPSSPTGTKGAWWWDWSVASNEGNTVHSRLATSAMLPKAVSRGVDGCAEIDVHPCVKARVPDAHSHGEAADAAATQQEQRHDGQSPRIGSMQVARVKRASTWSGRWRPCSAATMDGACAQEAGLGSARFFSHSAGACHVASILRRPAPPAGRNGLRLWDSRTVAREAASPSGDVASVGAGEEVATVAAPDSTAAQQACVRVDATASIASQDQATVVVDPCSAAGAVLGEQTEPAVCQGGDDGASASSSSLQHPSDPGSDASVDTAVAASPDAETRLDVSTGLHEADEGVALDITEQDAGIVAYTGVVEDASPGSSRSVACTEDETGDAAASACSDDEPDEATTCMQGWKRDRASTPGRNTILPAAMATRLGYFGRSKKKVRLMRQLVQGSSPQKRS